MTGHSVTQISLPAHARRHLGRHLAALYDSLPPAPAGPRLEAVMRRLQAPALGTADKSAR